MAGAQHTHLHDQYTGCRPANDKHHTRQLLKKQCHLKTFATDSVVQQYFKLEKVALDGSIECCAPPPRWCDLELLTFWPQNVLRYWRYRRNIKLPRESRTDARTDGQRHGRTTRKHIAYRRRRLKNYFVANGVCNVITQCNANRTSTTTFVFCVTANFFSVCPDKAGLPKVNFWKCWNKTFYRPDALPVA